MTQIKVTDNIFDTTIVKFCKEDSIDMKEKKTKLSQNSKWFADFISPQISTKFGQKLDRREMPSHTNMQIWPNLQCPGNFRFLLIFERYTLNIYR